MKSKAFCQTVLPWLKANGLNLGALTGQDRKALAAAVQIVGLYACCDEGAESMVVESFGNMVRCMQPSTRVLAYHSIAHVTDWSFRSKLWEQAGLAPIENPGRCKFE